MSLATISPTVVNTAVRKELHQCKRLLSLVASARIAALVHGEDTVGATTVPGASARRVARDDRFVADARAIAAVLGLPSGFTQRHVRL
jgi:hypothetical protein